MTTTAILIVKIKKDKVLPLDVALIKSNKNRESLEIKPQSWVIIFQVQSSRILTVVKTHDQLMDRDSLCKVCINQMKQLKEAHLLVISVIRCPLQLVSS